MKLDNKRKLLENEIASIREQCAELYYDIAIENSTTVELEELYKRLSTKLTECKLDLQMVNLLIEQRK